MNLIFNLVKTNKFKKLKKYLLKHKNINLDIKDNNYNYLVHYIINYNKIFIMTILLNRNIRLDILDIDGRTILYIPIKYNYIKMIKLLLKYNKKLIGVSILDIKDKYGLTALHYAVLVNNLECVKLLIKYNADPLLKNNEQVNVITYALEYNRNDILKYFIENNVNLNFLSLNNESFLQLVLFYQNYEIVDLILDKIPILNIDINNQELKYGLTALVQSITNNKIEIYIKLLNNNANINIQDKYGNTSLIYLLSEKKIDYIKILLKNPLLNYNLYNIDGNIGLHLLIKNIKYFDEDIIIKILKESNLSIQNNYGDTCLHYLVEYNLLIKYEEILINKELNIFIKNTDNISCYDIIKNNNQLLNIIAKSFYNYLKINKNKLELDWEIWCANDDIKKLKTLNNKLDSESICLKKINDIILIEKRSIPKLFKYELKLDSGIFINTCFYTGSQIDILFGILFLYKKFNNQKLGLILDYPLTIHKELENYYQSLGINFHFKLNFCNFEIIWAYQKIFFPTYFEHEINNNINKYDYIIIPIGIEIEQGSHANILFWDVKKKYVERFEPSGSNQPLNYNSTLLDKILLAKFKNIDIDIILITPKDYLPLIGFQILENKFNESCKRIGDPNGFCGVWCIWWIYQKMTYINIDSKLLAEILITEIKLNNYNFKTLIRNFTSNIVDLRDNYLKKYNLDINDWITNNYTEHILNELERDIYNDFIK